MSIASESGRSRVDDLCLWFAYNTFPSISHLLLSFIRDSLAFSHNSYSYPLILLVR